MLIFQYYRGFMCRDGSCDSLARIVPKGLYFRYISSSGFWYAGNRQPEENDIAKEVGQRIAGNQLVRLVISFLLSFVWEILFSHSSNEAGAPHVSCSIDGSFISAATELGSHRASPADIFFENNNNRPSTSADRSLSYQDISPAGGVSQSHKKLPSPNNLSIEMVPQSRRHSSTGLVRAEVEESTSAYLQVGWRIIGSAPDCQRFFFYF